VALIASVRVASSDRAKDSISKLTAASYISRAAMILSLVSMRVPIVSSFSTSYRVGGGSEVVSTSYAPAHLDVANDGFSFLLNRL
jgi:hypothetical protein